MNKLTKNKKGELMAIPTITIDTDKNCSKCGKSGTTESGLCMPCVTEKIFSPAGKAAELFRKIECEGDPNKTFLIEPGLISGDIAWKEDSGKLKGMFERLKYNFDLFDHLEEAEIAFLWKAKGGKNKGNDRLGYCKKPSGELAFYSDKDFLIVLSADHCAERAFTNAQILALLYHELRHTAINENGEFTVQGHEFEGFTDEIEQFGAWNASSENLIKSVKTLPLFD